MSQQALSFSGFSSDTIPPTPLSFSFRQTHTHTAWSQFIPNHTSCYNKSVYPNRQTIHIFLPHSCVVCPPVHPAVPSRTEGVFLPRTVTRPGTQTRCDVYGMLASMHELFASADVCNDLCALNWHLPSIHQQTTEAFGNVRSL